jgi:hypothetical protein
MSGFLLGGLYGLVAAGMADARNGFWKSIFWPYHLGTLLSERLTKEEKE